MGGSYLLMHQPTGRCLAADGTWSDDPALAVRVVDLAEAEAWVRRLACEPGAFGVVAAPAEVAA